MQHLNTSRQGFRVHTQQGMSYPFMQNFLCDYHILQDEIISVEAWSGENLAAAQLHVDKHALYGSLEMACAEEGPGKRIIKAHENDLDGFLVRDDFLTKFADEGCAELADIKYQQIIQTRYYPQYPGGLLRWTTEYETAFVQLNSHRQVPYLEDEKCKIIRMNLYHESTVHIHQHVEGWIDYSKLCHHLKKLALYADRNAEMTAAVKLKN